jgi:hypothetical protein
VPFQRRADRRGELGRDGGQDLVGHLDDGDVVEAAVGERVGQLQADVAGADDDRPPRASPGEPVVDGEDVGHRVQHVHAGQVQAVDRRARGDGAGPDDQLS